VLQPFETSVVRAIHVRDGQSVKAGKVLIELDPTMNEAERNHLRSDLTSAQLDVARLRAALTGSDDAPATRRKRKPNAEAALASIHQDDCAGRGRVSPHLVERPSGGRTQGGRSERRLGQGRAADQIPSFDCAGCRHGAAAGGPYHRGCRHAGEWPAVVVPADSHLEIEAMVSNRDIGFVHRILRHTHDSAV
jgi:Biotin-lipoyl like